MAHSESVERTAFVLAGGGSLGAVQVGMLAEIIGAGLRPDVIVGVSAGALNGAFLAFDPSPNMVEQMAVLWSRMTTRSVTRAWIDGGGLDCGDFPNQLLMHTHA